MTMNRPHDIEYNDLNGEETLQILHTRFWDLLHDIPELQERFSLTRVVLRLEIALDIYGAVPPRRIIQDHVVVRTRGPSIGYSDPAEAHHRRTAEVDSRSNPPDLVREEHGLPLPRAVKGISGFHETAYVEAEDLPKYAKPPEPKSPLDLPASQSSPTMRTVGQRTYASWVDQDQGSVQAGDRSIFEGPVIGGAKISESSVAGGDHAPVQADFRVAKITDEDKARSVVEDTIDRGLKIDRELESQKQKRR